MRLEGYVEMYARMFIPGCIVLLVLPVIGGVSHAVQR